MKAMVLAAGVGARLRPLTDSRPKALVEISGRTLLEITLARLRSFGVRDVIINVHHLANTIEEYIRSHDAFGMHIQLSPEEVLLDTGGGLKNAAPFSLLMPAIPTSRLSFTTSISSAPWTSGACSSFIGRASRSPLSP